tara:strand:- start:1789 stop:2100 length:312 start_codon:yes stop_codon:yes gene_type:complete
MDELFYLYEITLQNYIESNNVLEDYPIYETILIDFIKKHFSIISSKEILHKFILYLHYELDCIFFKIPKHDVRYEINKIDKSRLRAETKKLAKLIQEKYLSNI